MDASIFVADQNYRQSRTVLSKRLGMTFSPGISPAHFLTAEGITKAVCLPIMIPGFIISWLTFPGVFIHEVAHELFCVLTRTRVLKVCYFQFGIPPGFVVHEKPTSAWKNILIGVGPLIVNTGLGLVVGMLAIPYRVPGAGEAVIFPLLMWLAISIAMHSFPSPGDAKNIWAAITDKHAPPAAKAVGTPLCGLILFGAIGSIFWLDLAYGIGIVIGIPEMLNMR